MVESNSLIMILVEVLALQVQQNGHMEKKEGKEADRKGDGEITGVDLEGTREPWPLPNGNISYSKHLH